MDIKLLIKWTGLHCFDGVTQLFEIFDPTKNTQNSKLKQTGVNDGVWVWRAISTYAVTKYFTNDTSPRFALFNLHAVCALYCATITSPRHSPSTSPDLYFESMAAIERLIGSLAVSAETKILHEWVNWSFVPGKYEIRALYAPFAKTWLTSRLYRPPLSLCQRCPILTYIKYSLSKGKTMTLVKSSRWTLCSCCK